MSKIDNIANIQSSSVQKKAPDELPAKQKKGGTLAKGPANAGSRPAFRGAKFDKHGYCLRHVAVQLAKPAKDENGRVVFQELRPSCPSCQSEKHKAKRVTSLGGGKEHAGRRMHGTPARSRSKSRGPGESRGSSRARSRARDAKPRREYDTPFDGKGRCHYHVHVQLASKKMTGGWKVLQAACPKCMEEGRGGGGGGDDRSVRSGASRKSQRSGGAHDGGDAGGGDARGGDARGRHDKNGCCVLHPHIQVAKKKLLGGGFRVLRDCPQCAGGGDVGADDYSVKSGRSAKSARSAKSGRSARSGAPRGKPGAATGSGRYGALPFDAHGYCCRHPSVQLAKKKPLGGFKMLHHVCPECQREDGGGGGGRAPSRHKSRGTGRVFDDAGSEAASSKSGASSAAKRNKRLRVRNLRTEDEEGRAGQYTGFVNAEHQPHGDGVMKYADGSKYDGVWSEGSKVHGKTTKGKGQ